jgi:hypothetical protein
MNRLCINIEENAMEALSIYSIEPPVLRRLYLRIHRLFILRG